MADPKRYSDKAEEIKVITERLEAGIKDIFSSDKYKEYLNTLSKFHDYSYRNCVLIQMQKPDATLVAGFNSWRNNFGRNVLKGETGIRILAYAPYNVPKEEEVIDKETGLPILDANGQPKTEKVTITIPAFKPVSVFDVSQTEGKELPQLVNDLTGKVEDYDKLLDVLRDVSPVPIKFEEINRSDSHGFYSPSDNSITVKEGMSQAQTVKTAIHEIAHAMLHDPDNANEKKDRRTKEVEAESVAYTVCQHFGIDSSDYSFAYVASWSSGKELSELESSLETIRETASELITKISEKYLGIEKDNVQEKAEQQTDKQHNDFKIIGNVPYRFIKDKQYIEVPAAIAQKAEEFLYSNDVKYSGKVSDGFTTFTVSKIDADAFREFVSGLKADRNDIEFNIYQLKGGEEYHGVRFESFDSNKDRNLSISDYELVYTGKWSEFNGDSVEDKLNQIYDKFNLDIPGDFKGHSLSVSDVITVGDAAHYVDDMGFTEMPDFFKEKEQTRSDAQKEVVVGYDGDRVYWVASDTGKELEPSVGSSIEEELTSIAENNPDYAAYINANFDKLVNDMHSELEVAAREARSIEYDRLVADMASGGYGDDEANSRAEKRIAELAVDENEPVQPVSETVLPKSKITISDKGIIGNTPYKDIDNKMYIKMSAEEAIKAAEIIEASGAIGYSGRIIGDKATITISSDDEPLFRALTTTPEEIMQQTRQELIEKINELKGLQKALDSAEFDLKIATRRYVGANSTEQKQSALEEMKQAVRDMDSIQEQYDEVYADYSDVANRFNYLWQAKFKDALTKDMPQIIRSKMAVDEMDSLAYDLVNSGEFDEQTLTDKTLEIFGGKQSFAIGEHSVTGLNDFSALEQFAKDYDGTDKPLPNLTSEMTEYGAGVVFTLSHISVAFTTDELSEIVLQRAKDWAKEYQRDQLDNIAFALDKISQNPKNPITEQEFVVYAAEDIAKHKGFDENSPAIDNIIENGVMYRLEDIANGKESVNGKSGADLKPLFDGLNRSDAKLQSLILDVKDKFLEVLQNPQRPKDQKQSLSERIGDVKKKSVQRSASAEIKNDRPRGDELS
ncbi:MAG: ssDNA-binding domain-containing protein [Oscillospiraceae bacterium]|nr:ssDNA-binding domain-containing protein [Oscillospiraceae bacterium]